MGSSWIRGLTGSVCSPCTLLSQPWQDAGGSGVPSDQVCCTGWEKKGPRTRRFLKKRGVGGSKGASSLDTQELLLFGSGPILAPSPEVMLEGLNACFFLRKKLWVWWSAFPS